MSAYKQRSGQTELIDTPGIPFPDWSVCLNELNIINTWLGGHGITVSGVRALIDPWSRQTVIAEIGCGGGDNLRAIEKWNKKKLPIRYLGIDINQACVDFADDRCKDLPGRQFICSDYREVEFNRGKPDIIFSSLFCHHFSNHQLVEMLRWSKENASAGFFINDLQRHPVAFHSIRILTKFFSRSYLVRNDAPISVMRGFRRREWVELLTRAGITSYRIKWKWAFRYLIIVTNE